MLFLSKEQMYWPVAYRDWEAHVACFLKFLKAVGLELWNQFNDKKNTIYSILYTNFLF